MTMQPEQQVMPDDIMTLVRSNPNCFTEVAVEQLKAIVLRRILKATQEELEQMKAVAEEGNITSIEKAKKP